MKHPTLSLACILKNERHNLDQFLGSFNGCVDEFIMVDTGSNDGSVEYLKELHETGQDIERFGAPINLQHFQWIDDFSAARNYSFSFVKTDFVMWADLDDVLSDKEIFKAWKKNVMPFADFWLATYHYASNAQGIPTCSFVRERVINMKYKPQWKYFVHEGIVPPQGQQLKMNFVTTWNIVHKRTPEDQKHDTSRNLRLFEKNKAGLNGRMTYYWGKELVENNMPVEAIPKLQEAVALPESEIEHHDRLLGLQYLCLAYMSCNQFARAIQYAHQGLQLEPNRAEFHIIIADSLLKQNKHVEALPFYAAAKHCVDKWSQVASPVFSQKEFYGHYPTVQRSKILYQMGDFEKCKAELEYGLNKFPTDEIKGMYAELDNALKNTALKEPKDLIPCDDIVFTTPPQTAYEFDEKLYHEKSMGGSETALIEMAAWLKKLTGLPVKVFNMRAAPYTSESGVEYLPVSGVSKYFTTYMPKLVINWRHNFQLTKASPTVVWSHDLTTPGAEDHKLYSKIMCLTPFHADYVHSFQGIPREKIMVTRNGIRPERFAEKLTKDPNKIVWPSSPDRGLDRCILALDLVREEFPDIKFHVFYGRDHLPKYGLGPLKERLDTMISSRPWITDHGATQQDTLINHFKEASVWPYTSEWLETYGITALEMVCSGVYSISRKWGGVQNVLEPFVAKGMAELHDDDPYTDEGVKAYAEYIKSALREKKWEKVSVDPNELSWQRVAQDWIKEFNLKADDLNITPVKFKDRTISKEATV